MPLAILSHQNHNSSQGLDKTHERFHVLMIVDGDFLLRDCFKYGQCEPHSGLSGNNSSR